MQPQPTAVDELYLAALEFSEPDRRAAYLDNACAGKPELRARVERLLLAQPHVANFLESQAPGAPPSSASRAPTLTAGSIIGPYKLLQQIGEGGMGLVFVAEQSHPVKRRVAIKLLKSGQDNRQVIARFEAERQALALMDHPNIAKVLDAGETDIGQPYFVMELVNGIPITKYCDQQRLSVKDRLELFVRVCQAVQHAHHKGVIHRDLKPSNVLVALYDNQPVPKVIDFGVAKAIGPRLTEKTLFTEFGSVIGTVEYMSPEQAQRNQLDVDTRTDIYSLGVLLYELLTGTTPLGRERVKQAAVLELLRLIQEEDTPKPSTRLGTTNDLPTVAANRKLEPAQLDSLVRGELDWIAMKALEKDRNQRYETANGFAMDVQRYLADEPVQACPPSIGYRLWKFARRNKGKVTAATVMLFALLTGILGTTLGMIEARRSANAESIAKQQALDDKSKALAAATAEKTANEQAQDERKKADVARNQMADSLKREQLTSYVHRLGLAQREWQAGEVGRARQLLDECPANLRHWEWHYLRRLCNTELVSYDSHSAEVISLAFNADGTRIASVSKTEVRVWDSATGQEVFTIAVKDGAGAAFSSDGMWLAITRGTSVSIHHAVDGAEKSRIKIRERPVKEWEYPYPPHVATVAFSPDGRRLATAGSDGSSYEGTVKVWDVDTGEMLQHFAKLRTFANAIAFSQDGGFLAASTAGIGGELPEAGRVLVWDAVSGKLRHTFQAYEQERVHPAEDTYYVTDMAVSPDSLRLASSGSDGTVRIWDLTTGREALALRGHVGAVRSVAFSPNGKWLASTGADRVVRVWNATTGDEVNAIRGHTGPIRDVAFSPDSRRLVSAGGAEVRVWDPLANQEAHTFLRDPKTTGVYRVAFSPDGRYLASASISGVIFWDVANEIEHRPTSAIHPGGMSPPGPCLAFSPEGTTIATTGLGGATLWDLATGEKVRLFPDHPEVAQPPYTTTYGVAINPDGSRVATVGAGLLTVWEAKPGRILRKVTGAGDAVAFSPDGRRIATATRGASSSKYPTEVKIWDTLTGEQLNRFTTPGSSIYSGISAALGFSPDGKRIATATGPDRVTAWEADSGKVVFELRGHTGEVFGLSFSPDGRRIATASGDQTVKIWDAEGGQEVLTLRGHGTKVVSVAFSPDGQHLASASPASPSQVKLWTASSPKMIKGVRTKVGDD